MLRFWYKQIIKINKPKHRYAKLKRAVKLILTFLILVTTVIVYGQNESLTDTLPASVSNVKENRIKMILRTDVLPLMNTLLEENSLEGSVSAELCFGKCYSLILNCNAERYGVNLHVTKKIEPGAEIRWYFEASKEANLHVGLYSFFEFSSNKIDKRKSENQYLYYRESYFESGISGGCCVALTKRIQVDIASYIGGFNRYHINVKEQLNRSPAQRQGALNVRIVLGLGVLLFS
jgi:hypothetical protein